MTACSSALLGDDDFVRIGDLLPVFFADLARRAEAAGDAAMAARIRTQVEWMQIVAADRDGAKREVAA